MSFRNLSIIIIKLTICLRTKRLIYSYQNKAYCQYLFQIHSKNLLMEKRSSLFFPRLVFNYSLMFGLIYNHSLAAIPVVCNSFFVTNTAL